MWGYEDAGERWLPVHTVESVVRFARISDVASVLKEQLISVISLLSADVPDLNSPANVDAAKEVRENFAGEPYSGSDKSWVLPLTMQRVQEEGSQARTAVCGGGVRLGYDSLQ